MVFNYFDNTYLDSGQLSCTICKIAIRSEKTWNIHIKTNLHLENIKKLKEIKETKCPVVTVGKKRPPTPPKPKEVPEKRSKPNTEPLRIEIQDIEHSNDTNHELDDVLKNQLPEGFFDDPKEDAKVLFLKLLPTPFIITRSMFKNQAGFVTLRNVGNYWVF